MNVTDILDLVRELADKNKVDPVDPKGEFITLTPNELVRLATHILQAGYEKGYNAAEARWRE